MRESLVLPLAIGLASTTPALPQDLSMHMESTLEQLARVCPGGYTDEIPKVDGRVIVFRSHCVDEKGKDTIASARVDIGDCKTDEESGNYACPALVQKIVGGVVQRFNGCMRPDFAVDRFGLPYIEEGLCKKTETFADTTYGK